MSAVEVELPDAAATVVYGATLSRALGNSGVVYLSGTLGAGKTALVRALLRARGVTGTVRSPTYTLLECYETAAGRVLHLDLYRLADPEELAFIGAEEIGASDVLSLIEWPQRGAGFLPAPDLELHLAVCAATSGRRLTVTAHTGRGQAVVAALAPDDTR
ncbi:tRNA (adenosine(37)-N6)-threonylcarbamoyltransferase complex ATPase subunit type 1 TsaE [Halorhodospira abdelmalekii]|nr:tRNA (adenosine(37)-N6)-threonylcarbamoyltransferase complex ATPase subunit type 1 TsaE [Halorhodospira abdelmalekii]